MQFVFGDNATEYTLLYFDDQPDAAEEALRLVRMSYAPNSDYQSVGFVPFGDQQTRALFFSFQNDAKTTQNAYFLHGVYGDAAPEYFCGNAYISGLFTMFLNQDQLDTLRAQVAAGEKPQVSYGFDQALAATAYDQIAMESAVLHKTLTKLYEGQSVVLVMDDDKFSNDRARLIIKKIFRYLTPSLRKICSYITAVEDTGDKDFMLRIIPRCMLKSEEAYLDLEAGSEAYQDQTNFPQLVAYLMGLDDAEREAVFAIYEDLCCGMYKEQQFEKFYLGYTCTEEDGETLRICDELLTDYLAQPQHGLNSEIPQFLQDALWEQYASEEMLDTLVDWRTAGLETVEQFSRRYADVLRKVFCLCDRELDYFRQRFHGVYRRPYKVAELNDVKQTCNETLKAVKAMADPDPCETNLLKIVSDLIKYLKEVLSEYTAIIDQAKLLAEDYIQRNCKSGISEPKLVVQYVMGTLAEEVDRVQSVVLDIESALRDYVLEGVVNPYNAECNRLAREKRDKKEQDTKNHIFMAFVQRLKQDSVDSADTEEAQENMLISALLAEVDIDPMGLTGDDLYWVAEDDGLRPRLAQEICDYVLKVCAVRNQSDFEPDHNENLKLVKHLKLCLLVAKKLCDRKAADYAVLYLMAYCPRMETVVKYILQLPELDDMNRRQLASLKTQLPNLLTLRRKNDELEQAAEEALAQKAKEILDDKSVKKPRKVMATMVCDLVAGREPILVRERKRNMIFGICSGVVLALIAALVVVLHLPLGKPLLSNIVNFFTSLFG